MTTGSHGNYGIFIPTPAGVSHSRFGAWLCVCNGCHANSVHVNDERLEKPHQGSVAGCALNGMSTQQGTFVDEKQLTQSRTHRRVPMFKLAGVQIEYCT